MNNVRQTKLHTETQTGNCLAACVASLLCLDIDEIPHPGMRDREDCSRYLIRLCVFLATLGWALVEWPTKDCEPLIGAYCADVGLLWIAGGPTVRGGAWHSVVMRGADMVHDPHPSGDGLVTVEIMTVLTPLDASSMVSKKES